MIDPRESSTLALIPAPNALLGAVLLALAMIIGGGGSTAPLSELALELSAAFVSLAWIWMKGRPSLASAPRSCWVIVSLLVAIPLVQLIPLPPALWHHLPGHETERTALALVGQADSWRPWSVQPSRTCAALLSLGPCIMVMLITAQLDRDGQTQVVAMVAVIGMIAIFVGTAQVAAGDNAAFRFYGARSGDLEGFQANRNHAADVLLIAMVAFASSAREWRQRLHRGTTGPAFPAAVIGVSGLFAVAVVVTSSRAGVAMLPLSLLGVLLLVRPWLKIDRRYAWLLALVGAIAVLAGAGVVRHNHVLARVAARFTLDQEFRPRIWEDSLYAVRLYFPFGSGMGTFVPVFQAVERLENVDIFLTNRAHNDYLELAIEGGLAGIAALLACGALIVRAAAKAIAQTPGKSPALVIFALVTLCVIALHSLVDYPLRTMSLQCLAGLAVGLLASARKSRQPHVARDITPLHE